MAGLTATRLARLQMVAEGYLPDQCTILRDSAPVNDAQGGWSAGTPAETTVACRIRPATGEALEAPVADELASLTRWILRLPAGTDIRAKDRVRYGSTLFEVAGTLSPASWEIHRVALLVEINRS